MQPSLSSVRHRVMSERGGRQSRGEGRAHLPSTCLGYMFLGTVCKGCHWCGPIIPTRPPDCDLPCMMCPRWVDLAHHAMILHCSSCRAEEQSQRWMTCTVNGQNTIGIYITPLVLIQPTDVEQNAVNNNWLLKLQPAVKLQSWQKSNFHQIE